MKRIFLYCLLGWMFAACDSYPDDVAEALREAGSNRRELQKVLRHYRKDSVACRAACFLIGNMRWHDRGTWEEVPDIAFSERLRRADSLYYQITGGVNNEILRHGMMNHWLQVNAGRFNRTWDTLILPEPGLRSLVKQDLQTMTSAFLISHIDNALWQWRNSPYCRNLSFEDFCEYILPYRALPEGMCLNGQQLAGRFLKHLDKSEPPTLGNVVERYRLYIENIRLLMGNRPRPQLPAGMDIFFRGKRDCVPQCDYECQVLRACGVPAAIDINIGNREFVGQHHHCVVFDSAGHSLPFHGETNLSENGSWGYALEYKLNVYRSMYGAQKDSPYLLRLPGEALPEEFCSPAIREVTDYLKKTYPVRLKLPVATGTRLAWLYSYSRMSGGCMPVTWGVIDTARQEACFAHVVPNILYFPAYLGKDGKPCYWGEPIFVYEGFGGSTGLLDWKELIRKDSSCVTDLLITRKFPRKPNMLTLAANMVGGKFYGANEEDGRDREELYRITSMPDACLNEYPLENTKAWKYYIYEAPAKRGADISVLEFLADSSRLYAETAEPLPRQIFSPAEAEAPHKAYVKLLPVEPEHFPEYDGNMQTSSSRHRIVFRLKEPRVVSCIRMAPKNADNIIYPDEDYELFYWDQGWQLCARVESQYNYLYFKSLRTDRLYWLRNNSRGREEVPFVIRDGKPAFIYYDVLTKPVWQDIYRLPRQGWKCRASSEEPQKGPYEPGFVRYLLDDNRNTHWHTQYTGRRPDYPHWFVVDAGKLVEADGFWVTPRGRDVTKQLRMEISIDGKHWEDIGVFILQNNSREQQMDLDRSRKFRYFRITCLNGYQKTPYTSISEVGLYRKVRTLELKF